MRPRLCRRRQCQSVRHIRRSRAYPPLFLSHRASKRRQIQLRQQHQIPYSRYIQPASLYASLFLYHREIALCAVFRPSYTFRRNRCHQ